MFVVIFSSTSLVAASPPLFPQANTINVAQPPLAFKGLSLLYSGKYNESITYFDKALAINPNDLNALIAKGLATGGLGKINEAITYYDKALVIDPKAIGALASKGLALSRLGKYNEAITYYDKALSIDPNYPAAVQEKEMTLAIAARSANSTNTNSTVTNKP